MIYDQTTAQLTAKSLLQINAIKLNPKNPFQWASGWNSPIYCDNRIALSFPEVRNFLAEKLADQVRSLYGEGNVIAGVATGAIGIGMLVAQRLDAPFIYVRPEAKSHGRQNQIEGNLEKGQSVVVIEDLISTGKSSLNAVRALKNSNAEVKGMVALFTYGFDVASDNFAAEEVKLHTLCDYDHLLEVGVASNYVDKNDLELLRSWKKDPANWSPA